MEKYLVNYYLPTLFDKEPYFLTYFVDSLRAYQSALLLIIFYKVISRSRQTPFGFPLKLDSTSLFHATALCFRHK